MNKSIQAIFAIVGILVIAIFTALIFQLFNSGDISYTGEEEVTTPVILNSDPMIGSTNPKITVVFYGSFSCKTCEKLSNDLREILKEFPTDMIIVWKDFPNESLNPESTKAAIAARCAQEQNQFWAYHDLLMSHQNQLGNELYKAIGLELNLKENKFNRCIDKESTRGLVDAGFKQSVDLGLPAAPTIYINGTRHSGEISKFEIRNIIESYLEA